MGEVGSVVGREGSGCGFSRSSATVPFFATCLVYELRKNERVVHSDSGSRVRPDVPRQLCTCLFDWDLAPPSCPLSCRQRLALSFPSILTGQTHNHHSHNTLPPGITRPYTVDRLHQESHRPAVPRVADTEHRWGVQLTLSTAIGCSDVLTPMVS